MAFVCGPRDSKTNAQKAVDQRKRLKPPCGVKIEVILRNSDNTKNLPTRPDEFMVKYTDLMHFSATIYTFYKPVRFKCIGLVKVSDRENFP